MVTSSEESDKNPDLLQKNILAPNNLQGTRRTKDNLVSVAKVRHFEDN